MKGNPHKKMTFEDRVRKVRHLGRPQSLGFLEKKKPEDVSEKDKTGHSGVRK